MDKFNHQGRYAMFRILISSVLLSAAATTANAGIVAEQIVEKETVVRDAHGADSIQRVIADKVAPGEQVIYSLRFTNDGDEPAEGVVLVMPAPAEISYVEGSVSGANARVTFSADNGASYVARGRLTIAEDGAERPARGNEITHIKWTLNDPLAPGAKGQVSFRGVLQ